GRAPGRGGKGPAGAAPGHHVSNAQLDAALPGAGAPGGGGTGGSGKAAQFTFDDVFGGQADFGSPSNTGAGKKEDDVIPEVTELMNMGFSKDEAIGALEK
ncbi:hypothetical protein HK102_003829, partial [Quaeritorhiza haematococci]